MDWSPTGTAPASLSEMRSPLSRSVGALLLASGVSVAWGVCSAGCSGNDVSTSTPDATSPSEDAASVSSVIPDGGSAEDASPPTTDATPSGDAAPGTDAGPPPKPGIPIDAGPTISGTITVDPTTQVGTIPPAFVGLSYEKAQLTSGLFAGSDAPLIALFKLLGPGLLRIGGNTVDRTEWYSAPTSDAPAASTITTAEVDALSAFAKGADWKVLY